jgi:hypothetical protein
VSLAQSHSCVKRHEVWGRTADYAEVHDTAEAPLSALSSSMAQRFGGLRTAEDTKLCNAAEAAPQRAQLISPSAVRKPPYDRLGLRLFLHHAQLAAPLQRLTGIFKRGGTIAMLLFQSREANK